MKLKQQYHKSTNSDIYLQWQLFSSSIMETRDAADILVSRSIKVCSNDQHLQNEIKHLKKVLRDISGYPNWIIEQTIEKVKNQSKMAWPSQLTTDTEENEHLLMLPYQDKVGETRLVSLWSTLKSVIPANNMCKNIYTGTKLASKFSIKRWN